ncbi:MAG: FtsB family cell division protein [Bacteroidales bacterium]
MIKNIITRIISFSRIIFGFLKNKYILALVVFFIWLLFFDQNNLIDRFRTIYEINQLKKDKNYYIKNIEENSRRLDELQTDDENLEKFAREQYYMKKENEDIFIVIEED